MSELTDQQRRLLANLCDTLLPALPIDDQDADPQSAPLLAVDATRVGIPRRIESDLRHAPERQRSLARLLKLLESPWCNGWFCGQWEPFSRMSLPRRNAVVCAWTQSRMPWARRAMLTLSRLVLFYGYTVTDDQGDNPTWAPLQYPGRRSRPPAATGSGPMVTESRPSVVHSPSPATDHRTVGEKPDNRPRIVPWSPDTARDECDADVLVIGSGAGGGVVAAELAAAGLDVLVVEKGAYFDESSFPDQELAGNMGLYERRGAFATADENMLVLAGSNVGGGTTVNWMTCLPPPEKVLQQWSRESQFPAATGRDLQASLETVSRRLNVNTLESAARGSNERLERGCRALGYQVRVLPRNVRDCGQCDFCVFGCDQSAKQDVRTTYLTDAWQAGARILPRAETTRLLHRQGQVRGAELRVREGRGQTRTVQVRCRAIVVAAGAIHSPALLMRSGIGGPHLGRHLHLHPTTAVFAHYEQPVFPWQGPPQTRLCDQFDDLDGQGHGVRLETCPVHPGMAALAIPWKSGADHKRLMRKLPYSGNIIVLTRDRHCGRVRADRQGRPVVHYRLHTQDATHVLRGTVEALRVQRAAGALRLYSPHNPSLIHDVRHPINAATSDMSGTSMDPSRTDPEFEKYLQRVQRQSIRPHQFGLYSAHQLSTCRLHGSRSQGVVDPQGRVWGHRGLYVADGSVLPSSSGVNPMLTIMALAHYLTQHIKADICR